MEQSEHQYDVYISHCDADRDWVEKSLLPALETKGLRVNVSFRDSIIGMPIIKNIESAIANSYRAIVVITPDWQKSEWNALEEILVRTRDPDASKRKLLPLLLKETEVTGSLTTLNAADFTNKKHQQKQFKRLIRDIRDHVPPPPRRSNISTFDYLQHWLRYYRKPLRIGLVSIFAVWFVITNYFQIFPFHAAPGWQKISNEMRDAREITRLGDTLFVTTGSDFDGSDSVNDTGLWRSKDEGGHWSRITISPLKFNLVDGESALAEMTDLAAATGLNQRMYASTMEVGLLRNDQGGDSGEWYRIGKKYLPDALESVAVSPEHHDHVFVNSRGGELYVSTDGGQHWEITGHSCASNDPNKKSLPHRFIVYSLLVTKERIYVGSYGEDSKAYPKKTDGVYSSDDNGICWIKLHDAAGRYNYIDIIDGRTHSESVLVLTVDSTAKESEAVYKLWRLSEKSKSSLVLWEERFSVESIFADDDHWYLSTALGKVVQGSLQDTEQTTQLPQIIPCLIPPSCIESLDFAANSDAYSPPLILARNHVFKYADVSWLRRLWP